MPILLLDVRSGNSIEVNLSASLENAIAIQIGRVQGNAVRSTFSDSLQSRLETTLWECLDWDIKPPTAAQVTYAKALAVRHRIDVPAEALAYRFQMAMFIAGLAPTSDSSKFTIGGLGDTVQNPEGPSASGDDVA